MTERSAAQRSRWPKLAPRRAPGATSPTADALRDELAAAGLDGRRRTGRWLAARSGRQRPRPPTPRLQPERRARHCSGSPRPTTSACTGCARGGPTTSRARSRRSGRTREIVVCAYVVADVTGAAARRVRRRRRGRLARRGHRVGRGHQRRTPPCDRPHRAGRWIPRSRRRATCSARSSGRSRIPRSASPGPFGIVTHDLREFDEAPGPGPCDAIEGYCMAMRRDVLASVEGFDERFRWYRTADIELSFRVKDRGLRTEVVPVPVVKHEHRMWFETDPAERAKWSKRNFYRFLDRWRDRWDLVLDPRPPRRMLAR